MGMEMEMEMGMEMGFGLQWFSNVMRRAGKVRFGGIIQIGAGYYTQTIQAM